jgi:MFS family permease
MPPSATPSRHASTFAVGMNPGSTYAPLRNATFRRLWAAGIVSNLGFWMQQIAAGWLMVELTRSPALVALLATAAAIPTFVLALPAGALADVLDRRRLIIATQSWQALVAAGLGALALADAMTPGVLLAGVALYGLGATLGMPPQQAIVPELVAPEEVPQAVSLNAVAFTVAQAAGPALGGLLVAAAGPGWAFVANAVSFAGVVVAVWMWRRPHPASRLPAEHILGAIRTGARYVTHDPPLQVVLARAGLHVLCFAALPALLAVAVRDELHGGAGGYGLALAALGVGGVLGALLVLPRLRRRLSIDQLGIGAAAVLALGGPVTIALAPSLAAALAPLVAAGAASLVLLTSLNASAQGVLPAWVRGRGLAVYQLVFQAGLAGGAILWGTIAANADIRTALLAAGAAMTALPVLAVLSGLRLGTTQGLDLTPTPWPGDHMAGAVAPDTGPVMVIVEYRVAPERADAFVEAIHALGRLRRRDGAIHWLLATDLEDPKRHLETYLVSSFAEYERQAERTVRADLAVHDAVRRFHLDPEAPRVRHLVGHHSRVRLPHLAHPSRHAR